MELLKSFYEINSKSGHEAQIKEFFKAQITGLDIWVEEESFGNIFITKGCADDKNGLWIISHLLHTKPVLKAVLFVQEERDGEMAGCRGSRACRLDFFNDVRYLLAVDRKGNCEVVTVGKGDIRLCDDEMFPMAVLHKYGYECVPGGRTDVAALKERGLQVPCCNIGCGYYNAHKSDEYTIFSHLQKALAFVSELIDAI